MKILGLLGGMSWESTQPYYARINQQVQARLGGGEREPAAVGTRVTGVYAVCLSLCGLVEVGQCGQPWRGGPLPARERQVAQLQPT